MNSIVLAQEGVVLAGRGCTEWLCRDGGFCDFVDLVSKTNGTAYDSSGGAKFIGCGRGEIFSARSPRHETTQSLGYENP